jgi:hypothetical protein
MMSLSDSIRRVADFVGRAFPRLAIVIVGFIMMAVGLVKRLDELTFCAGP